MTVKLYKDSLANAIFIEDNNGAQFLNSLQAFVVDGNIDILDLAKTINLVSNTPHTDFRDVNDAPYTGDVNDVTNELNAVFQSAGTNTADIPVITSTTTINSVTGSVINYEMLANFGVGYEWDNLPTGLTTVEGNTRKLVGGSNLSAGIYTPTMRAVNYNGEDSQTLTITVANPPFANTKSIRFNNNDYCSASPSTVNPLYRPANGVGVSDAWTISLWFKAGTSGDSEQTLLMFGGSDQNNEGRVQLWYDGSNNDRHIRLRYGTNSNHLEFETPNNGIVQGTWNQLTITYDGGATGQSQGDLNDYYSRFSILINGVSQVLNKDHSNDGWSGSIKAEYFRLGRNGTSSNYMRNNCLVDEVALWASDEEANALAIYNSGVPFDLTTLGSSPTHWWRMGDGDTYPTLVDSVGNVDFTMNSMTVADIVNDVP
ncbi:MAG: hypothetical protein HRU12_10120 [Phaeodactylibacter sp.]|nr:hypothetical protein [Phaeodactylibacter sp.]